MVGCVPNFGNYLVERRITVIDEACMCRITPSQLNNSTRGFDPVQFFLDHWNCCALHEFRSSFESNSETSTFHGGAHLTEIVPHPDLCPHPVKLGRARQDDLPGRGPPKKPNYHDVFMVECTDKQKDWALDSYISFMLLRLLNWDIFSGGAPFHPVTYGLELNDFDDRQICHLPIKEHGNPIVKNETEAGYLEAAHPHFKRRIAWLFAFLSNNTHQWFLDTNTSSWRWDDHPHPWVDPEKRDPKPHLSINNCHFIYGGFENDHVYVRHMEGFLWI